MKKRILISRVDSIGDVVLTLPMCGILKKNLPNVDVIFIGANYTKPICEINPFIDEFINFNELLKLPEKEQIAFLKNKNIDAFIHVLPKKELAILARKANIPIRTGTYGRPYHWYNCNKLIKLHRKKSDLHEAQLNTVLLKDFDLLFDSDLESLSEYVNLIPKPLPEKFESLIKKDKINLILHPKSKGSAVEWSLENFTKLVRDLPKNKVQVFVTGTKAEQEIMQSDFLDKVENEIIDLTGQMSLDEFVSFISKCDALVAASTGPLHLAGVLGIKAIGLFASKRPIHPGRWKPIGKKATYLVYDENCEKCKNGLDCNCINNISTDRIIEKVLAD